MLCALQEVLAVVDAVLSGAIVVTLLIIVKYLKVASQIAGEAQAQVEDPHLPLEETILLLLPLEVVEPLTVSQVVV